MDINLISMPADQAWDKATAYKERLAKMKPSMANAKVRAEYETALKGFEALAKGTPMIDLDDVMTQCPLDEKSRPKLAIARADRKQVKFKWEQYRHRASFSTDYLDTPRPTLNIEVDMGRYLRRTGDTWKTWVEGYALVPMVPLDVRPKVGVLEGWHILWEVERWADDEIKVQPDIDPYLLKHVTGSFYAVIAEWNLTPLERSIMRRRVLDR